MTNRVPRLVLAAVLASSFPVAASAGGSCDRPHAPPAWPSTAAYPVRPPPPAPAHHWREARWRERELAEIRARLGALDAERARFHARYGHRPGKVRKFERWYAMRRAELERRWWELQPLAWR